jgi:hypothetical protein
MTSFKAKVQAKGPNKAWSFIDIPLDVEKAFGAKGRVSVKATLGKETFHTSIFPHDNGARAREAAVGVIPTLPQEEG